MATPITAPNLLKLSYQIGTSLIHNSRVRCLAQINGGNPSGYELVGDDASTRDPGDVATDWWTAFKTLYTSSDHAIGWELFSYVSGALIPLASGALSIAGTGSGTTSIGSEIAWFGYDVNRKPVKVFFYETIFSPSFKEPFAASGTDFDGPSGALLANTGHAIGNFMRSRGNVSLKSGLSVIGSTNRKVRRLRGIA